MDILADVRDLGMPDDKISQLANNLKHFSNQWGEVFAKFGHHNTGELAYRKLIVDFQSTIAILTKKWLSEKGKYSVNIITSMLLTTPVAKHFPQSLLAARAKPKPQAKPQPENFQLPEFEKPIFIVSAPRAGSTLLFQTLSQFPDIWTIGDESHEIIEGIPQLHPAARNFTSNRLTESDAIAEISSILHQRFVIELQNRNGNQYLSLTELEAPKQIRFLEKTPKNALRIPFLKAVFPDALFIYLYREAKENISSLIEGWRTGKFLAYSQLPGWAYCDWRFLLPPGWLSLQESSIPEIAAYQWQAANSYILSDLQALSPSDWFFVSYLDLVKQPEKTIKAIGDFAGLDWDKNIETIVSKPLAIAKRNVSNPSPDKWRKYEHEISPLLPNLEAIISKVEKIRELVMVNS
ncbi:MAG TPA: sulfotransferase [Cyanobacteria bacterium UBA11149]|nr:sulfotransferase [Cyanobacteria bacterium UBA11367]HBE59918.1 sulfotransferase [Cyanobacteria bacterium UBA11366]HBR75874.1 sulfotransferase [Cyanobacteria bacterium UBA11159]HBS69296.1 sulfotransferase [Cyanobacteria bacterium UBA11153]HBW90427.1 sulfotransferase [Cyanobacteria bacterium UBA11149]HCA96651.1 sulfotransferase [Cyanobacteria bacterium UBA9226]